VISLIWSFDHFRFRGFGNSWICHFGDLGFLDLPIGHFGIFEFGIFVLSSFVVFWVCGLCDLLFW